MSLSWLPGALLVLSSTVLAAQERVTEFDLRVLMNEQHRAATQYRTGDLDAALSAIMGRSPSLNHRIAERIVQWLGRPQPPLEDRKSQQVVVVDHWDLPLIVALGSLHMERALRIYEDRGTVDDYRASVRSAGLLFEAASRRGHEAGNLLPKWILAIGSTAHADGELWFAAAILDDGCRDHQAVADLLVACGAVHEAIALLPAHILLTAGVPSKVDEGRHFSQQTRQDARLARNRHLGIARRVLETALDVSPEHDEARLRLAAVIDRAGDPTRAQTLLGRMVNEEKTDRRTAFLVRLMAGRLKHRTGAAADAVAPLEQAIDLVPSAQSAYVALASALHTAGRRLEAAAIVEQMLAAPRTPPDPWGSYAYGQYWIPRTLLTSLREEARR